MERPKLYINDKARKKIKGLLKIIEDDISDIDNVSPIFIALK